MKKNILNLYLIVLSIIPLFARGQSYGEYNSLDEAFANPDEVITLDISGQDLMTLQYFYNTS